MKIISKFKDYYDYVAHQYGGGDEKITYVRNGIDDDKCSIVINVPSHKFGDNDMPYLPDWRTGDVRKRFNVDFKLLVVVGKSYLIVSRTVDTRFKYETIPFAIINNKEHDDIIEEICDTRKRFWFGYKYKMEDLIGVETKTMLTLSRIVKHPVFVITNYRYKDNQLIVNIEPMIPNLGNMGMASFIRPEIMYQDISYFVGNTMHDTPDAKPPVSICENDRIVKAGFDLKKSFRHRI